MIGFEIEHKYLIRYPDPDLLRRFASPSEIVQTYLLTDNNETERVRKRCADGRCTYTHTRKNWITDLTRVEIEDEISEEEYLALLSKADPKRTPVRKTRWVLPYEGQDFEIDVYPFWTDRAIMELETESEQQQVHIPEWIQVIREVSGEIAYSNSSIAIEIPEETI